MVKALKISVVNSQMLKRAGQSLDLAVVAAVTMESMGVILPDVYTRISSYSNTVLTHY